MLIQAKLISKTEVIDPYFSALDHQHRPVMELRIAEDYPYGSRDERCTVALAVVPMMAPVADRLQVGEYYDFAVTASRMPVHQFFNIMFFAGIRALITSPDDLQGPEHEGHSHEGAPQANGPTPSY